MKHITFYLDFISPYAFLAFEKLPDALQGLSYCVDYKPV
ncbi:MAG TPA: 2-hydroxychromene-2-carboxylate isomerase, partial [Ramlibacter sp.]|nr:2-hydroxychromene-2-carboxylate isomerase [Ramlibacter sp.]